MHVDAGASCKTLGPLEPTGACTGRMDPQKSKLVNDAAWAFCTVGNPVVGPLAACCIDRSYFSPVKARERGKVAWQARFQDRMLKPVQAMSDNAERILEVLSNAPRTPDIC